MIEDRSPVWEETPCPTRSRPSTLQWADGGSVTYPCLRPVLESQPCSVLVGHVWRSFPSCGSCLPPPLGSGKAAPSDDTFCFVDLRSDEITR